jgi:sortase (surface protein transpeptidase)
MRSQDSNSKKAGGVLIAAGMIVILAVIAGCAGQQMRGQQLRAALQRTPTATHTPLPANLILAPRSTPQPMATRTMPAATAPVEQPSAIATAERSSATTAIKQPSTPQPAGAAPAPTDQPRPVVPTPTASPELPARLVIPDLKIDTEVVEMGWEVINTASGAQSEWIIPKNAAGHHINSATMDQSGNLVISGHNNIDGKVFEAISLAWDDATRARVDDFTDRSDILTGRKIQLYTATGRPADYIITDFLRLRDSGVSIAQRMQNARFVAPTDESQLTLVTCWPPWSNTHRLVLIAKPSQP